MTDSHASQATEPTIPSASPAVDQVGRQPNLIVGIAAALGLGLVAAGLYALVAALTDTEIGYLALLIGVGVALGFTFFGKVKNLTVGIVAAVIAGVMFIVALFIAGSGFIAREYGVSFFEGLDLLMGDAGGFVSEYFQADVKSYLFLLFAVAPAFVIASGIRDKE